MALSTSKGSSHFNFGYSGGLAGASATSVRVPVIDLDTFFAENIPKDMQVIAIKLDVEGAEFNVMKSATQVLKGCRVKHWAIGIHNHKFIKSISTILIDNGYTIDSTAKD